ncbi:MAG: Transcriptional regulator YbhD, LysR family [uncultured Caballeronia sp.]|nr:MAG: Transcriptional regulator YbhD, LysR family [uncultured Caballeronia sp.]
MLVAQNRHVQCRFFMDSCETAMKVENSELEAFVAVAELGSFQKAADRLHLT